MIIEILYSKSAEWLTGNPITASILILIIFILYKIYTFNEIIKDSEKEVPNEVRMVPGHRSPPAYPNGWIPVLESALINRNQVKSVVRFGQELVIARGPTGQVYVIDAYCPHLGANFGVGGAMERNRCGEDCIRCPFHGWAFRMKDGTCVDVPYEDDAPKAQIKLWKSVEVNGVIFVWYHAEMEEPQWNVPSASEIDSGEWIFYGRTQHTVNCHQQEVPENGADVAHLGQIHTNGFYMGNQIDVDQHRKWYSNILSHEWHAQWMACQEPERRHMAEVSIRNINRLFGRRLFEMNLSVTQIGPAYVILRFHSTFMGGIHGALLQQVTPIGPMKTMVVHNIYMERSWKAFFYSKFLILAEAKMLERDIRIWNRKAFLQRPFIGKTEKSLIRYRRWFHQFYSENSKRPIDW